MPESASRHVSPAIGIWLGFCCLLIFAMVVLGGAVRLTGSGLSMVDWHPLMGAIPPLNHEQWMQVFERYQQYPEYKLVNRDMSLGEFRFIFLMEYAHRLLGRVIGLAFFVPFLWFMLRHGLHSALQGRLWVLLFMGAVQGLIGWYMVKSGLVDDPRVSQYRLALHFMVAVLIYAYMLRVIVGIYSGMQGPGQERLRARGFTALLALLLMMTTGAFVAGTHAGYIFNTWPAMGGQMVPDQLFSMTPWWRNFFENTVNIQFVHRWLAFVVLILLLRFATTLFRDGAGVLPKLLAFVMLLVLMMQLTLGIATLLYRVPVVLGVAHQAGALLLLTTLVVSLSFHLAPIPATGKKDVAGPRSV